MKITIKDFQDYVAGWLIAGEEGLTLGNMKAALHNALVSIECEQDGIEAEMERKAYYASLPQKPR